MAISSSRKLLDIHEVSLPETRRSALGGHQDLPTGGQEGRWGEPVGVEIAGDGNATVDNVKRWFVDDPIVGDGRDTEVVLNALAKLAPAAGFGVISVC